MTAEKLIRLAAEAGASAAAFIKTEDIALSEEFRAICEKNSCGKFGRCYMCPPFTGDIAVQMQKVRSFPGGILYQSVGTLEDPFDFEGMMNAAKHHAELSRRIDRSLKALCRAASAAGTPDPLPARMLHLSNGGCDLCETCGAIDGTPCRFPELAMPSVESCGVDVYRTARAAGLRYNNGPGTVTYFGLLLFDE